jgi:hypothetical protein
LYLRRKYSSSLFEKCDELLKVQAELPSASSTGAEAGMSASEGGRNRW